MKLPSQSGAPTYPTHNCCPPLPAAVVRSEAADVVYRQRFVDILILSKRDALTLCGIGPTMLPLIHSGIHKGEQSCGDFLSFLQSSVLR